MNKNKEVNKKAKCCGKKKYKKESSSELKLRKTNRKPAQREPPQKEAALKGPVKIEPPKVEPPLEPALPARS